MMPSEAPPSSAEGPPAPAPDSMPSEAPPVVLPPPLPAELNGQLPVADQTANRQSSIPFLHGRLHPLTLLFALVNPLKWAIVPIVAWLFFGRGRFDGGFLLVFVAFPLLFALVRYFTFTYRIADGELRIHHGLLQRTERNIRLDRVQDIRLEQGLLHRAFGMTDVHVETAGGQGAEASLSVLSRAEAERLRQAVFARGAVPKPGIAAAEGQEGGPAPSREIIRQLSLRDLALVGLTSNHVASATALVFVVFGVVDDLMPSAQRQDSSTFSVSSLKDASSLAAKLKNRADDVSAYIQGRLKESTRADLAAWKGLARPSDALQQALIDDLNAILLGASIWDESRFARVKMRAKTRKLLESKPTGTKLARLNKLLLEDAYRRDLSSNQGDQYERTIRRLEQWMSQVADLHWLVVLGALALVLVGMVLSVIGSIVTFYGFTLSQQGEDLHRSYGLLTRRASSLPRKRIQVLKIEETLLRRVFRLITLRADTAGSNPEGVPDDRGGRDVLLPVLPKSEVRSVLPVIFPDFTEENAPWRQVSRRAIRRATTKGAVVCLGIAVLSLVLERYWLATGALLCNPIVYALSVLSYRHLAYALEAAYFRTRRGWLSRATHLVPIRNAQAIVIRQTPFDRRHGVATLSVDTAGQANTGGGPQISNLPWDEALTAARTLAHRAAELRYRW